MPRTLPVRPNVRNLRNQAKRLLKSIQAGSPAAAKRIRALIPRYAHATDADIFQAGILLQQAQFAIARDYGFASWAHLLEKVAAEQPDADKPVAVTLADLDVVPRRAAPADYVVTLGAQSGKIVQIVIGLGEGQALERALCGVIGHQPGMRYSRPMSHDLFRNMLKGLHPDLKIERLTIGKLQDQIFFATLSIRTEGQTVDFDARPSDGLILAVSEGAPIFVARGVMDAAGRDLELWAESPVVVLEGGHDVAVTLPHSFYTPLLAGQNAANLKLFESLTGVHPQVPSLAPPKQIGEVFPRRKRLVLSAADPVRLRAAEELMKRIVADGRFTEEAIRELAGATWAA